jgi:hypothetical protein
VSDTRASLVDGIIRWGRRLIPDRDRAERLADDLMSSFSGGERDATGITDEVVRQVESVCHRTARHLTLEVRSPAEPDVDVTGWPPVDEQVVRRRAGFVRRVERFGNGHGLLQIDGFDDITASSQYVLGAFSVLSGVDGLILDLRHNGGGAPSTLALVAEFVLGTGIEHLSTVRYRDRPERQWWTSGQLGHAHLPVGRPVAVLIGPGTYSSGEALAYHLQTRGRVRLFGQQTPGAADHVTPIRVTPSVVALLPEGIPTDMVSGGNWEGVGVLPDVRTEPDDSEAVATAWLATVTPPN